MRRYVLYTLCAAMISLTFYFFILLGVPSPIAAEYWIRELMVVKRHLAESLPGPRLVFLGGSATLFGIDAKSVGGVLGLPSINMGLQAALRLERVLSFGSDIARSGDILVLHLEQPYYGCEQESWSDWQLRNSLAWDRAYFASLPLPTRIWAAFSAGGPALLADVLGNAVLPLMRPGAHADRAAALAPSDSIWARYRSGVKRTNVFAYSAYNLDDRGDMTGNLGAHYFGPNQPANVPAAICSKVLARLKDFVAAMKARGARVFIAHAPYLIDGAPYPGWPVAEARFSRDVAATGAELLDSRDDLFLPRSDFFDTVLHLNEIGRRERTNRLIARLRSAGIVHPRPGPDVGRSSANLPE